MTALFLTALSGLILAIFCARRARLWGTVTVTSLTCALACAVRVLAGTDWTWRAEFTLGGEAPVFLLDGISAFFLVPVCVIGALSALYALEYWSDRHHPGSAPQGRAWTTALLLGMILVLGVKNGLHFLLAWEIFAISAYFLITLEKDKQDVRKAGWLYLAASHAGTMALFAFFSTLAVRTGSWDLGPMRDQAALAPLFWLALFGFGVKAGLFPLHIWLPTAHTNAPSHVSAMMSAVAIKMGIYGIVRYSAWLPLPDHAGWIMMGLGATSALTGIVFAMAQNDIKRLLAYCSVENIGIILAGLGLGMVATSQGHAGWGRVAMCGTLLHIWNHSLFKSLLFLGAGSVLHATGTRDMSRLGGLWRALPWTASLFALGAVAVAGLPPLNGFVSEWMIYLGLIRAMTANTATSAAIIPAIIALAATGALALAAFAKATAIVFLGAPRTRMTAAAHECGWLMRIPMLVLAGCMLCVGLFPSALLPVLVTSTAAWNPGWTSDPAVAVAHLGTLHLVLALALLFAAAALIWLVRRNGLRTSPTWDCGYAAPTAHMQYTSGSFAGIVTGWFAWILRPESRSRRVRGHFPDAALQLQRIPETVLEKGMIPVGQGILLLADGAKKMQHGRLHLYILYVFAGATVLGGLAFWGGM